MKVQKDGVFELQVRITRTIIPGLTLLCLIKTASAQPLPPGAAHEKNQCANRPAYIALKNAFNDRDQRAERPDVGNYCRS